MEGRFGKGGKIKNLGAYKQLPLTGRWDVLTYEEEEEEEKQAPRYYNVSLPRAFVKVLDHIIDEYAFLGFVSRVEVVKEAVRWYLLELQRIKKRDFEDKEV